MISKATPPRRGRYKLLAKGFIFDIPKSIFENYSTKILYYLDINKRLSNISMFIQKSDVFIIIFIEYIDLYFSFGVVWKVGQSRYKAVAAPGSPCDDRLANTSGASQAHASRGREILEETPWQIGALFIPMPTN